METMAAVITGRTNAAICAIAVRGCRAGAICRELAGAEHFEIAPGHYRLCRIMNGDRQIDEVLIGRESDDRYVINCHGNPLIVEMITAAIAGRGVKVVSGEDFALAALSEKYSGDTLTVEAKLAQCRALSIEAVRLLQNQTAGGLGGFVRGHLAADMIDVDGIKKSCREILAASDIAERMLRPMKVVLAGLPNSGKSTLFNRLCGKDAAIVTDKRGTTRDWIKAACQFGVLAVEIIDTAGLDESLWAMGHADKQSQEKTAALIGQADIILLVIDMNDSSGGDIERTIAKHKSGAIVIKVYNKADICGHQTSCGLGDGVVISASRETNIDGLIKRIVDVTRVKELPPDAAVCFTARQRALVEAILNTDSPAAIRNILERIIS